MALLGEMHYIPLGPDSWVNLPRGGGVAYAAQESWVQNETIKVGSALSGDLGARLKYTMLWQDNILFGAPYDEQRYKKGMHDGRSLFVRTLNYCTVIYQCGLKRDLSLLDAGDATEVGEKGLTLR